MLDDVVFYLNQSSQRLSSTGQRKSIWILKLSLCQFQWKIFFDWPYQNLLQNVLVLGPWATIGPLSLNRAPELEMGPWGAAEYQKTFPLKNCSSRLHSSVSFKGGGTKLISLSSSNHPRNVLMWKRKIENTVVDILDLYILYLQKRKSLIDKRYVQIKNICHSIFSFTSKHY